MDWDRHHGPVDVRPPAGRRSRRADLLAHAIEGRRPDRARRPLGRLASGRGHGRSTSCSRWSACQPTSARSTSARPGFSAALKPGAVLVDMTTTEPRWRSRSPTGRARERRHGRRRAGVGRRRRRPQRDAVDHDRRRHGQRRARAAALRADGQDHRPPGRPGRRPAHQDVQPDPDRRDDDRRRREPALRDTGRPRSGDDAVGRSRAGRRAAGRWRTWRRASSRATSSPGSSSSTSSRTWASRWPRRAG